ncbi:MAG: enolase C-terminal domain-like protein, partial [Gemmataceae bacterium]
MRVARLELRRVALRLRRPVKHASHTRTTTENIVVVCCLDNGTIGYGEGVPRDYVTGESIETSCNILKNAKLDRVEWAAENLPELLTRLEGWALPVQPGDDRLCVGNAARCAVEMAVLDAYLRHFDLPFSAVTERLTPQLFQRPAPIQYSGIILSSKSWKLRALAWGYRLTGFRQIKVKVGIPGQDDPKRMARIRRCGGSRMDLRVDANEAWTPENATPNILALKPFGITSVEQPVRH